MSEDQSAELHRFLSSSNSDYSFSISSSLADVFASDAERDAGKSEKIKIWASTVVQLLSRLQVLVREETREAVRTYAFFKQLAGGVAAPRTAGQGTVLTTGGGDGKSSAKKTTDNLYSLPPLESVLDEPVIAVAQKSSEKALGREALLETGDTGQSSSAGQAVAESSETVPQQPEQLSCPVCLECPILPRDAAITSCGHSYCTACIKEVLQHKAECPQCRAKLTAKDVYPMEKELVALTRARRDAESRALASAGLSSNEASAVSQQQARTAAEIAQRHGSKLGKVVEVLQKGKVGQCLLFVQWSSLKTKVMQALSDARIGFKVLRGTAGMLADDQQGRPGGSSTVANSNVSKNRIFRPGVDTSLGDDARVLILSLEDEAAGLNLTFVSHVVFLHPMNAPSLNTRILRQEHFSFLSRVLLLFFLPSSYCRTYTYYFHFCEMTTKAQVMHEGTRRLIGSPRWYIEQ
ncbi:unnamed protein product [Amoebophrya sp. A25]|nr:unnamed protein product [Amoebophrya sp. A25]|eukprot:GSA25T00023892001.1